MLEQGVHVAGVLRDSVAAFHPWRVAVRSEVHAEDSMVTAESVGIAFEERRVTQWRVTKLRVAA